MKTFCTFLFLLLGLSSFAVAPVDSLGQQVVEGKSFTKHQVATGETWFAISRRYGISYAELRLANKGVEDNLKVGQIVLVPAKAKPGDPRFQKNYIPESPKTQAKPEPKPAEKTEAKPAPQQEQTRSTSGTHRVQPSETLYHISQLYHVKVDDLKRWNNLGDNSIKVGQELIVHEGASVAPVKEAAKPPVVKKEETSAPSTPTAEKPKKEVAKNTEMAPVVATPEIPAKTSEEKSPSNYTFSSGRKEVIEVGMASYIEDEEANPNKYFALHKTAAPNTVIKVTNKANGQSLFVKVIGRLVETGDNEGLIIKISKASAEKLGVTEKIFRVELIYGISE